MKVSRSILSHGAIFAVGIALAVVASQPGTKGSDASRNPNAHHESSRSSELSSPSASHQEVVRSPQERRDGTTLKGGSPANAAQRLAELVRLSDPLDRQAALLDLVRRLGPGDFADFADQYRALNHYADSQGEYELILRAWAKADPVGALDHANGRPDSWRDQAILLAAWAGNDAASAERWALAHHDGKGPNPFLSAVVRGIAATDIFRANELAASMPQSRERTEAMDAITRALLVQGTEVAMAYPDTIKDPEMRGTYISQIAERLARKDADAAAAWIASLPDAGAQNRGARRVAEALAQDNIAQAAAWVSKLQPMAQAEAARGVIVPMSRGDIPGTATWVATLSGIPNYDSVVEEFVWSCDYRSPEQSAAWIQGVSDPDQQARLYHRMLGEWAKRDATAVKNWVANHNVPNSVAKRFR